MLATGPIPKERRRRLVFPFAEAFKDTALATGVVRLHASEKLEDYREEMAEFPSIRFLENAPWSVDEAMAACDVVVINNSGLGNDALVMGRLVILMDVLDEPLSNGQVLADKAGCPIVRSASELRQAVDRILTDRVYRARLKNQAEAYGAWFCAAFGQEAARNVVVEVRRHVGGSGVLSR
jgi:hypothetical protein